MRNPDLAGELAAELARVEVLLAHTQGSLAIPAPPQRSPFARAAARFELDGFERWVLTLAAAAELEPRVPLALARRADNLGVVWPTVGLALSIMRDGDAIVRAAAFQRGAPLRAWGLVEIEGAGPLPSRAVRLGAGFASAIVAADPGAGPDRGLAELDLAPATRSACVEIARRLAAGEALAAVVAGPTGAGRDTVAAAIAAAAGPGGIARTGSEHPDALRHLVRDARWFGKLPIARDVEPAAIAALPRGPLIVVGTAAIAARLAEAGRDHVAVVEVSRPAAAARARLWAAALPAGERGDDLDLVALGHQFRIGPAQIAAAARLARRGSPVGHAAIEAASRAVSMSALGELAQPLDATRTLDDLIVPAPAQRELRLAIAWARHGTSVFDPEGAGAPLGRGPGLTCLFFGPSGTGKTLAAQVLANAIGLALYRVDLSQVMDKYIGETEKRLERLFTEADRGNAILFFDEADVLFARRTEVNDARDRYANLETGYLLQRLERHPGIVVLATNMRDGIDPAFFRRIHVVVELPAPRAPERAAIWRRLMPAAHAADIDLDWLAQRFALTGGEINNAIATGLLLATAEARIVEMADLVLGVWREVEKSGQLVDASQFGPWADRVIELVKEQRAGRA